MIVQVEIFLNQMELVNNVHHIWFQMLAQQNVVNNARWKDVHKMSSWQERVPAKDAKHVL